MPSSLGSRLATIVVLASAMLAVHADTFLGCTTTAPRGELDPVPYTAGAASSCSAYCAGNGNVPFYYYSASTGTCLCTVTPANTQNYGVGANTKGQCTSAQYYYYSRPATSFTYQGCYITPNRDTSSGDWYSNPLSCFNLCKSTGTTFIYPDSMTGTYLCQCGPDYTVDDTTAGPYNCQSGVFFAYTHPAAAAASDLARRNLRARLDQLRLDSQKLCPGQMKACKLEDTSDTYECVDTSSELESCGGCLFGEYGKDASNSTIGTDCSTLHGVSLGAATCRDTVCEAYACKKGYELVSGLCVATVSA